MLSPSPVAVWRMIYIKVFWRAAFIFFTLYQSNNGPFPAPAGRHESDPFSILLFSRRKRFPWRWFFFFILFLFLLSVLAAKEVVPQSWTSLKHGAFISLEERYQSGVLHSVFHSIAHCFWWWKKKKGKKSCEGKKIPLELQRFSHTLLNLPPTFVKELKGINRKEFLCWGIYLRDSGNICCKSESKLPT